MYAEALNEWKGAPTEEAYDAVNEIRLRAGIDEVEDLNYKQFQSLIQDERARELCYEGHRGSTLYDGEILVETVKRVSKEINSKGGEYVSEAHNLCPIPPTELSKIQI